MKRATGLVTIFVTLAFVVSACAPTAAPASTQAPAATEAQASTQAPAATEAEVAATAPQPTEAQAAEEVEIHLFHQYTEGGGAQPLLVQLTEEYQAEHPNVKVTWEWAGWEQYDQKLRARIEAGDPMDMAWKSAAVLAAYAREGLTVPLDEYLSGQNYEGDSTWKDSFFPSLMEQSFVEDGAEGAGYYGAPDGMFTSGIFYNSDIFAEHQITPPQTWDELIQAAESLKSAGITPFDHDGGYAPYNARVFMYVAARVCGEDAYYDTALHKPGTSWSENPCWLKAAEETQKLFGYFQPGFLGSQWPAAQVEFSQGIAAMMIIPDWLPSELVGTAPEDFEMAIFRFPAYEGGQGDQTASELKYNGFSLLKNAPHPEEAIDFLKFLTSRHALELQAEQYLISPPVVGAKVPDSLAGSQEIIANSKMIPFGAGVDEDAAEWNNNVLQPLLAELALGTAPADFISELQQQSDDYYADS